MLLWIATKRCAKTIVVKQVQRGYQLVYARYLGDIRMSTDNIEERFAIEKSTYYKSMNRAIATISVVLFGSESPGVFL